MVGVFVLGAIVIVLASVVLFGSGPHEELPLLNRAQAGILLEVLKDMFYQCFVRRGKLTRAIKVRRFFVTGAELVAQACYRRLITPRGMLATDPNYGLDVAGYAGALGDSASVALPAMVENELLKDDRVLSVNVTASRAANATAETLTLTIRVQTTDPQISFTLTIGVSDVSVEWLEVNR